MHPGAGADVDDMVGQPNGVFIMLNHQHGVAEVTQTEQCVQQAAIVALVQADGGLIQHVHHADQAGTNLAGQANALSLAAGQRVGATGQGQVVQPDIDQKTQALADFLEDGPGDLRMAAAQVQRCHLLLGFAHRGADQLGQATPVDLYMPRRPVQALAVAIRAGLVGEVFGQLLAHRDGIGLAIAALHVRDDPLEPMSPRPGAPALAGVGELDGIASAAVEHHLLDVVGQFVERGVQIKVVVGGQRFDQRVEISIALVPATNRAVAQRDIRVGHHTVAVEDLQLAQAVAGRAGPGGVVEREQPGLQLANGPAADLAGIAR